MGHRSRFEIFADWFWTVLLLFLLFWLFIVNCQLLRKL